MRYNKDIKKKVCALRKKGWSLNQINEETHVPKTTIRSWISDIILSDDQKRALKERTQVALQKGRIKAQTKQKKQRIEKENKSLIQGIKETSLLTSRELFIAGIALYWAEGFKNKHEHRLGFCNSDPQMIKFYIKWLEKCLGISRKDFVVRLTLNVSYKKKEREIKTFWLKTTGISLDQFTKTFYQNTKWKKQYDNDNYHGVLRIHVKNSLDYLLKMKGWIGGLKLNIDTKTN